MNFLNPIAFWGFLALIVPTIILLWSKRKQRVVDFGSLEFLRASESKVARSLFPTQWLLYFLRVSLISLLVFLLAQAVFPSDEKLKRIIIEKDVYEDPDFASVVEGIKEPIEIVDPKSLDFIIADVNKNLDSTIVYTRSLVKDFKNHQLKIANHVEWKVVPFSDPIIVQDTIQEGQTISNLTIISDENGTKWNKTLLDGIVNQVEDTLAIQLQSSVQYNDQSNQLKAMIKSFESILPIAFHISDQDPEWTILVDTTVMHKSEKQIHWNHLEGALALEKIEDNYFEMRGHLNTTNLLDSEFPQVFADVFLKDLFHLHKLERRIHVPEKSSTSPVLKAKIKSEKRDYYWWIFILILIFLERWFSHKTVKS